MSKSMEDVAHLAEKSNAYFVTSFAGIRHLLARNGKDRSGLSRS